MSLYPGDWKHMNVLSGQIAIADAVGGDVIVNAENGPWVVMCEYDDEHKVRLLAAMTESLASNIVDGKVEVDGVEEHETLNAKSGMVFMVDRKMRGKLPDDFDVPEERLNPEIVKMYGRPDDDLKPQEDRFLESCFHMGRDFRANMPVLEKLGYGVVCELMRGELDVSMLYNSVRDVVGIEVAKRR